MDQRIPSDPMDMDALHGINARGHDDQNWATRFACFIDLWNNRLNNVSSGPLLQRPLHSRSEYIQWYILRTRRWIGHEGARLGATVMLNTV